MSTPTGPEVLTFEGQHPGPAGGAKQTAIREQFGITTTRYYQILIRHTQTIQALQDDPATTRRINDQTARKLRTRTERRTS